MTIIPLIINQTPPKCPNCGNNENIQEVCKNCNHVYEPKSGSIFNSFGFWLFIAFHIAFFLIWIIDRTSPYLPYKNTFIMWYYEHIILTIWDALKNIF